MDIIILDTVDSTNLEMERILHKEKLTEGSAIFARTQTAGRGQRGNTWNSEAGNNLTLSFIFYPTFLNLNFHFCLSQAIALGVLDFFKQLVPNNEKFSLKWPNDIYFDKKKIGGILIENTLQGNIIKETIIGIGLNINQELFDDCIPNPISLRLITKKLYNLDSLIVKLSKEINFRYKKLRNNGFVKIMTEYNKHLFRKDVFSSFKKNGELFEAKILNTESDGKLNLITKENEKLSFYFKEIEFVI